MDKMTFFYFSSYNCWGNLNEIVALDYDNTNSDILYVVWCNSLMIKLVRGTKEFDDFMEAMQELTIFKNKKTV